MTKLYVGNLSYTTTEEDLQNLFSQYGPVSDLRLIKDRETQRSKGFAFITFSTKEAANSAMQLNDTEFQGRRITVSEAREESRSGGGRPPRGGRDGRR